MAINGSSRYINSLVDYIQLTENGSQHPMVFFDFPDLGDVALLGTHIYVEGERLDQLAMTYYKRPLLWWVIAAYNPQIKDPMNILPGTEIRIPRV